jgi:ribosomal protein S18 acetylase RimI-like enzyme
LEWAQQERHGGIRANCPQEAPQCKNCLRELRRIFALARRTNKAMLTIRKAMPDDAEKLAAMNKQLIEDEGHDNPMTIPQLEERMAGFISGDYEALLCVGGQNAIVGYALVRKTAKPLYLRQFFICRGERRKGYGSQFFAKLLEYFSADAIDIEVMAWNAAGKAFWESLGFKPRSIYMRRESG